MFSGPSHPASGNNGKMKEVPTFAVRWQFRVAEQVTCHNSGKSLWLDLSANSWHGMVEQWQGLGLTLCTRQQQCPSSMRIADMGISEKEQRGLVNQQSFLSPDNSRHEVQPHYSWTAETLQQEGRGRCKLVIMTTVLDILVMSYVLVMSKTKETLWQFACLYVPTTWCKSRRAIPGIPLQWSCRCKGWYF